MTQAIAVRGGATNGIRFALGFGGVLAIVVGALILLWPAKTAMIVTAIVAVYAIIAGIVYATGGIFSKTRGGWARVGLIVLGVLFIGAGIVAFANTAKTPLEDADRADVDERDVAVGAQDDVARVQVGVEDAPHGDLREDRVDERAAEELGVRELDAVVELFRE